MDCKGEIAPSLCPKRAAPFCYLPNTDSKALPLGVTSPSYLASPRDSSDRLSYSCPKILLVDFTGALT